MSEILIRDGKFDLVVAAAPDVETWPSTGAGALSSICAEMGLSVGVFGGDDLQVRGVIPLPSTGAIVVVEDLQARIHRIQARAVVKVSPQSQFCDPFPGWRSQGLVPLSTATRLLRESEVIWDPCTVILGSGNRALRFGTELLLSGTPSVYCIETHLQWGAKRFSGWEVERRRFEMAGGKLVEAKPVRLARKSAMLWELKLQDAQGVRLIETARVVSAGPFRSRFGVREHPLESLLFELDQTASATPSEDIDGWLLEEERARGLAVKIVRALSTVLSGAKREELDRLHRRARGRLKRYTQHLSQPFTPTWQGKWLSAADARRVRSFSGVPQSLHKTKQIASIECFEDISCHVCQTICPTEAIDITVRPQAPERILREERCTACGLCVVACPSEAISLLEEREDHSLSKLTLSWRGPGAWSEGEFGTLLNRRGDPLGSARVKSILVPEGEAPDRGRDAQLVQLEIPTHLAWEARGLRRGRTGAVADEAFFTAIERSSLSGSKVEITIGGEKRLVRAQIPVTIALYESGQNRSGDALFCRDGSCGLCQVTADGVKKLACRTETHRGMVLRLDDTPEISGADGSLCPCLAVTRDQVADRMRQGHLRSPEAVLSVAHVGKGKCHGRVCMGAFLRLLEDHGIETEGWIDWRFPSSEWVLGNKT